MVADQSEARRLLLTRVCMCVCVQWKKAEEMLEKELLEAEALDNKDKKIKLVRMKERISIRPSNV